MSPRFRVLQLYTFARSLRSSFTRRDCSLHRTRSGTDSLNLSHRFLRVPALRYRRVSAAQGKAAGCPSLRASTSYGVDIDCYGAGPRRLFTHQLHRVARKSAITSTRLAREAIEKRSKARYETGASVIFATRTSVPHDNSHNCGWFLRDPAPGRADG